MAHTNKAKEKIKANRGATFIGCRPQYFKHKDDKKEIRKRNKAMCRNWE
jgi:hypothetical protein